MFDPEYPISLVDLGLIRGVEVEGSQAKIKLTYTCMGCPAMDMIQDDVRDRLLEMDGIDEVDIEVVWETWSRKDITPLSPYSAGQAKRAKPATMLPLMT